MDKVYMQPVLRNSSKLG